MPHIFLHPKAYHCPACGYAQSFEPTRANMDLHFPGDDIAEGACPSCGGQMEAQTAETAKTTFVHPTADEFEEQLARPIPTGKVTESDVLVPTGKFIRIGDEDVELHEKTLIAEARFLTESERSDATKRHTEKLAELQSKYIEIKQ